MGPVRQNPIQRTVILFIRVCIALCTIAAHNIAQNRPDSFPPYPPDNHHCSDDGLVRSYNVTDTVLAKSLDNEQVSIKATVVLLCNVSLRPNSITLFSS